MDDDDLQKEFENVNTLLRELQILVMTMDMAKRMQDAGLVKAEALIACRALTFILEECPEADSTREERMKQAEKIAPTVREFILREIQELHDRKS